MELVHISKKELGDVKLLAAVQGLEAPEFSIRTSSLERLDLSRRNSTRDFQYSFFPVNINLVKYETLTLTIGLGSDIYYTRELYFLFVEICM